eukprot:7436270-Pyramimonas_sp.AAC.1
MGFPIAIIAFFQELYRSNSGWVTLGGRRIVKIMIERGVRQGDPASMILFALCTDPIMRWLIWKSGSYVH